jgi:DtxR family Mn-dependent transcriptional regulator
MPWEEVHAEACRWEHVMSESVERRLLVMLDHPTTSPYGNPIPGLDELMPGASGQPLDAAAMAPLSDVAQTEVRRVIVRRIAEPLQDDGDAMTTMHRIGAMPGASVKVHRSAGGVTIGSAGEYTELPDEMAMHVLVETAVSELQAGRWQQALADLQRAARVAPGERDVRYWLANAYRVAGQPLRSRDLFRELLAEAR